jgi:hypothetical protein
MSGPPHDPARTDPSALPEPPRPSQTTRLGDHVSSLTAVPADAPDEPAVPDAPDEPAAPVEPDGQSSPVRALVAEATDIVPGALESITAGLLAGDEALLDDVRRELDRARTTHRRLQRAVRDATGGVGPGSPDRVLGLACERLGALSVHSMVLLTRIAEAAPDAGLHRRSTPVREVVGALGATAAEAHRTAASAAVAQAGGLRELVELDRAAGRLRLELVDAVANAPSTVRQAVETIGRCYERVADTAISVGAEHAAVLGITPDERRRRVRSLRDR